MPKTVKECVKLPGIGYKMANLIVQLSWDSVEGIAVDTHMQRITQKLGWAGLPDCSKSPQEVEKDLEDWIPKDLWLKINPLIVGFGQVWCKAVNPNCEQCLLYRQCKWVDKPRRSSKKDKK